jgi:transcriptional regulator with XRE-family HTH domain
MLKEKAIHDDVRTIREKAGLSQEQLAHLLGTSWVSVSRWEREVSRPSSRSRAQLDRLQKLVERVGDALPREEIPHFLQAAHPLLRGYRPLDLLDSDYAFEDLLAFVDAAKSGDMA